MSQLTLSRAFFNDYEGATATIKTKHTSFIFFDPKSSVPLTDLLSYQAQIDEVEAKNEKSASGVVSAVSAWIRKAFFRNPGESLITSIHRRPPELGESGRSAWFC